MSSPLEPRKGCIVCDEKKKKNTTGRIERVYIVGT